MIMLTTAGADLCIGTAVMPAQRKYRGGRASSSSDTEEAFIRGGEEAWACRLQNRLLVMTDETARLCFRTF